jgi:UDP-3-O-[3-hydroxymyristoyl] glucosamine N-acyltransferase
MECTLRELADLVGGVVKGDDSVLIRGVSGLKEAGPDQITFLANPKYEPFVNETRAAAIIMEKERETGKPLIITGNPYLAFARVAQKFSTGRLEGIGVSPQAVVDPTARISENVSVQPLVYVGRNAVIGKGTVVMAGAMVDDDARIGEDCLIFPNVSILHGCRLGNRVTIHSGTVIGSDGFGYAQDGEKHVKIPQVGVVRIDDDVEIGANCTVDRGTIGDTWIKSGVKIDNLVQVAHNVIVGENTLLIAQVGVSGSSEIGRNVVLAGQVGVAGHIKVGDNVMAGGQSGLHKDVENGAIVSGSPAIPHRQWLRVSGYKAKLPDMAKRLNKLEERIRELEDKTVGG